MTQRHGRKDFFTYNMDSVVKTVEKTGRRSRCCCR